MTELEYKIEVFEDALEKILSDMTDPPEGMAEDMARSFANALHAKHPDIDPLRISFEVRCYPKPEEQKGDGVEEGATWQANILLDGEPLHLWGPE